ncbi:MAG: bifunctional serine/threonine-protein kinase/formylglycine-generating enzyme family protein [Kofleriaceae bacterium]
MSEPEGSPADPLDRDRATPVSGDAQRGGASLAATAVGTQLRNAVTLGGGQRSETTPAVVMPVRYELGEHLAAGGQGDVHRVYDRLLRRDLVIKVLGDWWDDDDVAAARFIQEAQITAQLQHPSIVPVHEIGTLDDGRPYYTMSEVRGRTLSAVIEAVHAASTEGWAPEPGGVSFRRLIDCFHRVCEAVGYAHTRGVVHRDLKPANIMLGPFGEVLVLDWGLARIGQQTHSDEPTLSSSRGDDDSMLSQAGAIAGTAGYMAPEQASGGALLGPPADVYALGMILREILTGKPPGLSERMGMLSAIVASPERPIPDELLAIAGRATSTDAAERYPDGAAIAVEVAEFLDGARKRERARELLTQAEQMGPRIAELERESAELIRRARAILDPLPPSAPAEAKEPGWDIEDAAHGKRLEADLVTVERNRLIDLSLTEAELPEAHALLAAHYRELHQAAEARRDPAARTIEQQLRAHDRGAHSAYLAGRGLLTLRTTPSAQIELRRYETRGRRLVDHHVRDLGPAPLHELELERGSYLLILRAPGHHEVRYPVSIGRQEHWNPIRPGSTEPTPVVLPRLGELDDDEVYVAGGPFWCGGDPLAAGEVMPRQQVWVDGFALRRHPVTNAELLAMVNALISEGRPEAEEIALAVVPRHRGTTAGEAGTLIWTRNADGLFEAGADDEGLTWAPALPTFMVNWHSAMHYAEWLSARTGRRYRLPGELEFEKAARGADARAFPWGDHFDATWACMRLSRESSLRPAAIDEFPVDTSPYLARGLAGNVVEWCADEYRREGPAITRGRYLVPDGVRASDPPCDRTLRGGCFLFDSFLLRAATRHSTASVVRDVSLGFRLARSLTPTP